MADGIGHLSLLVQSQAEIIVDGRIVGLDFQGLLKLGDGLIGLSVGQQIVDYNVRKWEGQGKSLELRISNNGDGTIDQTITLNDAK